MKKQIRLLATMGLVLASLGLTSAIAREQQFPQSTVSDSPSMPQQSPRLRQLRVNVPEGSSVTIIAESPLNDAVSYKSGDKFVLVIPQAFVASLQSDVRGRGFISMQYDQRGEDVAISFRLRQGATARVDQKANGLEVVFVLPDVAMVRPATNRASSPPLSTSSPIKNTSKESLPDATQPPVPATQGGGVPNLSNLLNSLFPGASNNVTANTSDIDLSVPESPAFTVLGVTPNTIVRPGTPREFATSLLNGLDQNGNFQSGLAIDTAPFLLFNGQNVTLKDYNAYYMTRLLSRTQFSFATTKGASQDDTATRLALGLNLTLWDRGDARMYHPERGPEGDVLTCFKANIVLPPPPSSATPTQAEIDQINASTEALNNKEADLCRDKARKANWNKSSWVIAYAPSWISKNGQNSSFRWNGGAFWTSFAYGFEGVPSLEKIGQLILHARYRTREQVPDPANQGKFLTQDSAFFGGRLRAGNPQFAFNVEGSFIRNKPLGGKATNSNRLAFGVEARVSDNLYFVISGGGNLGTNNGEKKGFVLSSFKYGFNKKSQFNPKP